MTTGTRDTARHPGREGRHPGPHRQVAEHEAGHSWWQVVCLTGVDYFSTIGYQPAIAFLAPGVVSPLATIVLIGVTLLGALPVYRRVAAESPRGEDRFGHQVLTVSSSAAICLAVRDQFGLVPHVYFD